MISCLEEVFLSASAATVEWIILQVSSARSHQQHRIDNPSYVFERSVGMQEFHCAAHKFSNLFVVM